MENHDPALPNGMKKKVQDVIIIGSGHAGLCISYLLKQEGLSHLVLEKNKIGNSWKTQRWDSFRLNTANKINGLPGMEDYFSDRDAFASAYEFAQFLDQYALSFELPVIEDCQVTSVEKDLLTGGFSVSANHFGQTLQLSCKSIVVASGAQNEKVIPAFSQNIHKDILQMHASDYRNAHLLPTGNVLVVGSAQSGVQIAEDLLISGRKVFLSTSKVGRIPRQYRGKDVVDWLLQTGLYEQRTDEVPDPEILKMKQPQVSGVGLRGKTSSLQELSRLGAVILGKMQGAEASQAFFQKDAGEHVCFADQFSMNIKNMIDAHLKAERIPAPQPEYDAADIPDHQATCASDWPAVRFKSHDITSIIWTTGFTGNFNYLKLPVFNQEGQLVHKNGLSFVDGLFFLSLPWMRKRKSAVIFGIKDDAEFITGNIIFYLRNVTS